VRLYILISAVCVVTAYGSVGPSGPCRTVQPEPGFDPKEVVRQIHMRRDMTGLRSGVPERAPDRQDSRVPSEPTAEGCEQPAAEGEVHLDGGEFLLDTNNAIVPAPGSQTEAAVGFDGTNFLVVWQDQRGGHSSDILGARLTQDGALLDPNGLVITQAAYDQRNPALAFDGTNFLVVWDDYRRGHAYDIYGTRVTTGGAILDPAGILVTQANNDQRDPDVAFDGTSFLVVWEDERWGLDSTDIYGARITTAGTVLDTTGLIVSRARHHQYTPAIGFDGANYLVVWTENRDSVWYDIYGARITPQGALLDSSGFAISLAAGTQAGPAVCFGRSDYLVVWHDFRNREDYDVYGTVVSPEGTVFYPDGFVIAAGDSAQVSPAIGCDGTCFLVAWCDVSGLPASFGIWGVRISPEGSVLDTAIAMSGTAGHSQLAPFVGFGGANYLVVWQDERSATGEPDVYGTRVAPGGTVLDPSGLLITKSSRSQFSPVIGCDGTDFLVVWEDDRNGCTDIYGARVTPSGDVLDPTGIAIAQAPGWQYDPVLAFDGSDYLVVWQDYRNSLDDPDIYGARVTPEGAVLDPTGIAISDAPNRQYHPALAFGGGNYLVIWQDYRNESYDLYGTRVDTDGNVLNTDGIVICQAVNWQCRPVMTFDGANFFAVWEDYRNTPGLPDVYGARIKTDGTVLDSNGLAITQAQNGQYDPAIAFDGTNLLVVWEDGRRSVWPDIYGTRVKTDGTVLDVFDIAISTASKDQFAPALAFDGTNYLVVWEDYRSSNNPDIYGARVSPAGVVSDEGSVLRPPGNQTGLALARGSGNLLFLAYQGWAGNVGGKTYNTDRIWGKMNPMPGGGIEETMNDERVSMNVGPTIVRGVLFLGSDRRPKTGDRPALLDISGRKVMDLKPGVNDVGALAPGVYFVRSEPSAVTKVIIAE